jgi:hypothetical protein
MSRTNLLGIFYALLCLSIILTACGEGTDTMPSTGGAPASGGAALTGGVGVTGGAAGTSSGGTTPIAGNGTGGVGGTAGGVGGVGPSGAGGSSAGTGGVGGVGPSGAGGSSSGAAGSSAGGSEQGGSGGATTCTFTVNHTQSSAIATVEVVTFSTTLAGITSARIDFGPSGAAPTMSAPVDLAEPMYRTLLLGMKGSREYTFRIVATSPAGTCTSMDYTLTTGAVSSSVPRITRTAMNAAAQDRGFIITSGGVGTTGPTVIIDADGDVVWWAMGPEDTSRARMSYDGKHMYMMALNVRNDGGEMRRVLMDGTNPENNLSGLSTGHHDFTVLPDNGIAVIIWRSGCTAIVERSANGTLTDVVANVSTVYQTTADCHTNAINYYPSDQTYTLSDRNVNLFVKIRRTGELVWQFGGSNARGQTFTGSMSWQVNHGHQLLPDGKFIFFNNGPMQMGASAALEYTLNTTSWTATKSAWEYRASGVNSAVLGDTQRLPNGNTLVTYSVAGEIHEVTPSGQLVQKIDAQTFGYAEFRKSLYGPPLR